MATRLDDLRSSSCFKFESLRRPLDGADIEACFFLFLLIVCRFLIDFFLKKLFFSLEFGEKLNKNGTFVDAVDCVVLTEALLKLLVASRVFEIWRIPVQSSGS